MKITKILIDFDDVLFDTGSFRSDFIKIFEQQGISQEQFQECYKTIKKQKDQIITYDFDAHVECLKEFCQFSQKALMKDVKEFLYDTRKYLFDDSLDFLHYVQNHRYDAHLVSFGTSEFQNHKVAGACLEKYFVSTHVGDMSKGEEARSILEKAEEVKESFFIDDRVKFLRSVKEQCTETTTILMHRERGRYRDEADEHCDHEVNDFRQVRDVVERIMR